MSAERQKIKLEEPKEKKESKRYSKWGLAVLIPAIIFAIGGLCLAIFIPQFINEGESSTMNIPFRYIFTLWLILMSLFSYAQIKDSSLFQLKWPKNPKISGILGSILIIPTFSFLFSFVIVYSIFSMLNYSYATDKVFINGELYKKEITEKRRGRNIKKTKNYYVYFNEDKQFRFEISKPVYDELREGDSLELKVLKGRLEGYYLQDSFKFSRLIDSSEVIQ